MNINQILILHLLSNNLFSVSFLLHSLSKLPVMIFHLGHIPVNNVIIKQSVKVVFLVANFKFGASVKR